jgi:sRNA-binding protein
MPSYSTERNRGTKESRQQLTVLREKWPLAFPVKDEDVRPLAIDAAGNIAATMGWSVPYTLGVLGKWKMKPVYCKAVLRHDQRISLDGAPAETVDANAKELAAKRLAQRAKTQPAATPHVVAKPKPTPDRIETPPKPIETPEQLRSRVRAALLRRTA